MSDRADIIITHARVLTMDESNPHAQALAIAGNRIIAVGTAADVAELKSPSTRIIDAQGCSVLPGFIESHMHLFSGAAELDNLDLSGVSGLQPLLSALSAYEASRPGAGLLIANQTNYTILSNSERLSRHQLDMAVPDRPLICIAPDHHTAWANTRALEAAGILHGRDLSVGNEIVMGKDGRRASFARPRRSGLSTS